MRHSSFQLGIFVLLTCRSPYRVSFFKRKDFRQGLLLKCMDPASLLAKSKIPARCFVVQHNGISYIPSGTGTGQNLLSKQKGIMKLAIKLKIMGNDEMNQLQRNFISNAETMQLGNLEKGFQLGLSFQLMIPAMIFENNGTIQL